MGNFHNFHGSENENNSDGDSFNSTTQLQARIQGHAQWVQHIPWMLVGMDICFQ